MQPFRLCTLFNCIFHSTLQMTTAPFILGWQWGVSTHLWWQHQTTEGLNGIISAITKTWPFLILQERLFHVVFVVISMDPITIIIVEIHREFSSENWGKINNHHSMGRDVFSSVSLSLLSEPSFISLLRNALGPLVNSSFESSGGGLFCLDFFVTLLLASGLLVLVLFSEGAQYCSTWYTTTLIPEGWGYWLCILNEICVRLCVPLCASDIRNQLGIHKHPFAHKPSKGYILD